MTSDALHRAVGTGAARALAGQLLLTPLLTQRRDLDDEFSRGWNAACAAMRSLLESMPSEPLGSASQLGLFAPHSTLSPTPDADD